MTWVNGLILLSGTLILLGVISSKFATRLGLPVLVLFIGIGMLAGSEGIGGIAFDDYGTANGIALAALAVILLDGGLRTPMKSIRLAWKPALLLATLGVLITAAVTALAAMLLFGLSFAEGLLLGGIIGSTDAAAVFAVMRYGGIHVGDRLAATVEIESGSNDPMAVFLTIGMVQIVGGQMGWGLELLSLFFVQMGLGLVVGLGVGYAAVAVINRINLESGGLYPILVLGSGLFSFGLAAVGGGSGFLAIYLTGIVLGNRRLVFQRGTLLFMDAAAWASQIMLFVMLGLLSFPSRLLEVAVPGLLVALVLIFLARPLATAILLAPFGFKLREMTFIAWAGLKGAVPITLATFPLLFGLPNGALIFNVVFFAVLVSAIGQGWTLVKTARFLKLEVPAPSKPPVTLEISSLRHVEGDIVEYELEAENEVIGHPVKDLNLPPDASIAALVRENQIIAPRGQTILQRGDHVFVVLTPKVKPGVDAVLRRKKHQAGESADDDLEKDETGETIETAAGGDGSG